MILGFYDLHLRMILLSMWKIDLRARGGWQQEIDSNSLFDAWWWRLELRQWLERRFGDTVRCTWWLTWYKGKLGAGVCGRESSSQFWWWSRAFIRWFWVVCSLWGLLSISVWDFLESLSGDVGPVRSGPRPRGSHESAVHEVVYREVES